ncbi:MAG: CRISPR-associated protein Cas4 [Acidobacteria bacterium]|nr:CRISPR-associated protein Cas4 [Acidobacteriota bacterium]
MYQESELLPLSGLQHLLFCERQWGLIHIEQQWEENRLTAEGRLLHAKADQAAPEQRPGVRIVRAMPLRSLRLGISGRADVVEFPRDGSPPLPVEYKRGKAKADDIDRVQVCAQALCLEEMLGCIIPQAALYYGQPRRRTAVKLDSPLRQRTEMLAARMQELFRLRKTPAPVILPHCRNCSLVHLCEPDTLTKRGSAALFMKRAIRRQLTGEENLE